jgi:hypothetical protein
MTAIERTEKLIKNGQYEVQPKRFRVYTLTLSPVHLIGGCDFGLYMSFDKEVDAKEEVTTILAKGLELALYIDGER